MKEFDPEGAQAHLQALHARFAVSLRERVERLDGLVEGARGGARDALDEALVVTHRLAGTAGSYGYREVGEAAAALERVLRSIVGGTADAGAWDEALAALARVRAGVPGEGGGRPLG